MILERQPGGLDNAGHIGIIYNGISNTSTDNTPQIFILKAIVLKKEVDNEGGKS
jgi:hypothetical protein